MPLEYITAVQKTGFKKEFDLLNEFQMLMLILLIAVFINNRPKMQ